MRIPRKKEVILFPPMLGKSYWIKETRSRPWPVVILDFWFLWAHEFGWLINKNWVMLPVVRQLCYAYSFLADYLYRYETVDNTENIDV